MLVMSIAKAQSILPNFLTERTRLSLFSRVTTRKGKGWTLDWTWRDRVILGPEFVSGLGTEATAVNSTLVSTSTPRLIFCIT
jgi:hypothetical protein